MSSFSENKVRLIGHGTRKLVQCVPDEEKITEIQATDQRKWECFPVESSQGIQPINENRTIDQSDGNHEAGKQRFGKGELVVEMAYHIQTKNIKPRPEK